MSTMIWSAAAAIGFFVAAVTAVKKEKPVSADAESPRVVRIGEMSVQRAAHQATLLATGEVLITGGCAGRGCDQILASVEVYDPAARSFRFVAPMSTPRASHAAILLDDGRVLITGGWTGRHATTSVEIFDPATGRFTPVGEMIQARVSHSAISLPNGRVLLCCENNQENFAEIFDPATATFSAVPASRVPAATYLPVALADGRVLVTGGKDEGKVLLSAEIFDPATGAFHPTGDMIVPRHKHAAAPLPEGGALIIGGSSDASRRGNTSTEFYDPATGEFSPGPEMRWPRYKVRGAVAVLPSGSILVTGGAARPELWDSADGVFVPVEGELSGRQMFATATLLSTGEVLVLGGYDDRIQSSASGWLVGPAH